MFLKAFNLIKAIDPNIEKLHNVSRWVFTVNHISKRNAGHSEWANRKGAREANNSKKSSTLAKIKGQIARAILREKNANPATNPKLQAVLAEAQKASISQALLDKMIKPMAATLSHDNINSFTYSHSLGITCIVEISSIHPVQARSQTTAVMKKFGFKYDGNATETHKIIGIVNGKQSENVKDAYDKAVEDAITVNCEEVTENDDGSFSFLCNPNNTEACSKSLSGLGYEIEFTEKQYEFPEYIQVDDAVSERLEVMEEKLGNIPGFVKIIHNVE